MLNMHTVLSEQEISKCAQAYALFVKARDIIKKGENYLEGLNLLKQMYEMIGEDGLQQVSCLENLAGEKKFTPGDFFEEMSWVTFKLKDFDSSLSYTNRWKELTEEKYGHGSAELAHCYRRLGTVYYSMKLPEKEFDEKYGYYDAPISLYQYLLMKASPFFWLHQNLQQSQVYFLKGYNLLKKSKGTEAPETESYKEQYVNFICWETATAHFEQTLWVLIALIPLLMIMVPFFSGLQWKSLGVAFIILGAVLAWRTISIFFYFFMAKRHYEQAIQ